MGAVEKIIMQSVLKSVVDYNNSIEILEPGVKKYFREHYDDAHCILRGWKLIGDGAFIEVTYDRLGRITTTVSETDIIPTEIIVSIVVDFHLIKDYETLDSER